MSARLTILGSGSSGNCALLETDQARLLIDAGFSARQIRQRLAQFGRSPETITGILITHEHSDHIQGLPTLAGKLGIPVYCNRLTQQSIEHLTGVKLNWRLFTTGAPFEIGDVQLESFSIPHDANDPVGFMIRTPAGNIGFVTDLGHATRLVTERLRGSRVLVLESNHDIKMLQDDPYRPWSLKQRILSRHGHLSNEASADLLEQLVSADLQHLYLAHLSRDCNRPEIAHRVMNDRLQKAGAQHVKLNVASQTVPCPTLELETAGATALNPASCPDGCQ